MNTSTVENEQTVVAANAPKAATKARVAPQKPRVATSKDKSGKKATTAKKGAKPPKKPGKPKAEATREGSKTEKILDLLKRPDGVTLSDLMKAKPLCPGPARWNF